MKELIGRIIIAVAIIIAGVLISNAILEAGANIAASITLS